MIVKPKILIIEDDPIIADYLSQLLRVKGFSVIGIAHNGERALDLIANLKPEMCICDIHLGTGKSGIDVAEIIDQKYHIPYIFLTSFDDDDTMEMAEKHGPYGYIVKPFQDRTLLSTIKIAWANYLKQKSSKVLIKSDLEQKIMSNLTDQEYQILSALLIGKSYKQIAESQFLTTDSIKYHAGKLYRKCNIKNRSELAGRLLS